jgi:hypothetical protein
MAKKRKPEASGKGRGVTPAIVAELATALPGVEAGSSYGTPGYRVAKQLFARLHQDGESLVVRMEDNERTVRIAADPDIFFVTDHYLNYPWVLVRLAAVTPAELREILRDAWLLVAPKKLADGES